MRRRKPSRWSGQSRTGVDLTRLEANLRMTPTQRLERHAAALAFVEEIRRSRERRLQSPSARPRR